MLFRSLRRKFSAESQNYEQICDTEFPNRRGPGLDLAVSVYRLEAPPPLAQIHAEHAATAGCDCASAWRHADLFGAHGGMLVAAPTDGPFAFARQTHHEIQFTTAAQLLEMVQTAWRDAGRFGELPRRTVREYVRGRMRDGDEEWVAFCAGNESWRTWAAPAGDEVAGH